MEMRLIAFWEKFTRPLIVLLGTLLLFTGCGTGLRDGRLPLKEFSGSPVPDWVYEPEYYVYRDGRYKFVKGHYRKVLFRKHFRKRSLRGYGSSSETAAR
jgi:hypothetical protein